MSAEISEPQMLDVAIIGAGFAGIGMAKKLRDAGINNVLVLERGDAIGGTWRDNHYPGCACDVPSHLYSFSFRQNPDWSRLYPEQGELRAYLENCVDEFGLRERIRLNCRVDTAQFDESLPGWRITCGNGDTLLARTLVSAIGGLSRPSTPGIPGFDTFEGESFHSADWDDEVSLDGKRVAVIGTGASAIQFVPRIADTAGTLTLFQRTPPWVVAKNDRPMRGWEKSLFRFFPPARWLFRTLLYWRQEVLGVGFTVSPRLMTLGRHQALRHLADGIRDPELRRRLTPDYQIGCKRVLLSDDYYPSLEKDNVVVNTDGIERFTRDGIVDATGTHHPVDVVIYATGFNAIDPLSPTRIIGRGGRELATDWANGPEAYLGISVAGYPNLFLLMGPNTGLGHNSVIFMIESQIRYVRTLIKRVLRRKDTTLDVREDAQTDFNSRLQKSLRGTVWTSGCSSWYQTDTGRLIAIWPGFTFTYWFRTLRPKLGRYLLQSH